VFQSYDSYIRLVKSELLSSPTNQPNSDVKKSPSPLPSFISTGQESPKTGMANEVAPQHLSSERLPSSESSGSEMTVVHDTSSKCQRWFPPQIYLCMFVL
jgi:hypothetical protein